MHVYVESNFVLELALLQGQWRSCSDILKLSEVNRVQLIVPGYCLAEPYETLVRRRKRRTKVQEDVESELKQIARTEFYGDQVEEFRELASFLIRSAEDEDGRLRVVTSRLLQSAEVISLNASILTASAEYHRRHGFSPQDAIVYASILSHLREKQAPTSCFLNRDKDFDDEDVVEELREFGCKLMPDFNMGYEFILDHIG